MTPNSPKHPEVSATITVVFGTADKARVALKALIPDNVNFPKGLRVKMFVTGSTLCLELHATSTPLGTVVSTLDEILEHVSMIQKVIHG
jgi:hypothetical protein